MDPSSVTSSGSSLQPRASSGAIASTLRAVAYTVHPLPARCSAVVQPMPDEQPVIKTALDVPVDSIPDTRNVPPSLTRRPYPCHPPLCRPPEHEKTKAPIPRSSDRKSTRMHYSHA